MDRSLVVEGKVDQLLKEWREFYAEYIPKITAINTLLQQPKAETCPYQVDIARASNNIEKMDNLDMKVDTKADREDVIKNRERITEMEKKLSALVIKTSLISAVGSAVALMILERVVQTILGG